MASLLPLVATMPLRVLAPGEVLLAQGDSGADLFVLANGRLAVERDGVRLATISHAGAAVGEMSVLRGTPYSATVHAETATSVRVVADAANLLQCDPTLALRLATLLAARLHDTSALLVELGQQHQQQAEERQLVAWLRATALVL